MIVIDQNDTTHNISLIPRTAITDPSFKLFVKNELTKVSNNFTISLYTYSNGFITFSFDLTVQEDERYSIKLEDSLANVLYRGKIYVTDQTTQNFDINE